MGKFAIECSKCGNYVTAYNGVRGLFQNKVKCACGNEIDVRSQRMAATVCSECGNTVMYDQGKGEKATCPVCGKSLLPKETAKVRKFNCAQCGIELRATEGTKEYVCPVCDCKNDVVAQVEKKRIQDEGLISVIKYEGDNHTLVWKHPIEDFNMGTQLIVHESQEAIFLRDGQALDLFGPGRYTIETQNLPVSEKIYQLPTGGIAPFHAEVYFINQVTLMGIKWGTDSRVRILESATGIPIEIGASGEFNIQVCDSRKLLLKLVGTEKSLNRSQLLSTNIDESELLSYGNNKENHQQGYFRSLIMNQVKSNLARVIKQNQIPILEIDMYLDELSLTMKKCINQYLENYGLVMPEFFIARVVTPENDPNYIKLKELKARRYLDVTEEDVKKETARAAAERKVIEAQTDAQMKLIQAQAEAESYKMKAQAEAEEMRMKGYTYQQETARQVGLGAVNGATGMNGGDSSFKNILDLGVGLGIMENILNTTRDALKPHATSVESEKKNKDESVTNINDIRKRLKEVKEDFEDGLIDQAEYEVLREELMKKYKECQLR